MYSYPHVLHLGTLTLSVEAVESELQLFSALHSVTIDTTQTLLFASFIYYLLAPTMDRHYIHHTRHSLPTSTQKYHNLYALRTLTYTRFGKEKESLNFLYIQFIHFTLNYASPA